MIDPLKEDIILFDIDKTLFNTDLHRDRLLSHISDKLDLSNDFVYEVEAKYFASLPTNFHFNVIDFIKQFKGSRTKLDELIDESRNDEFLYPIYEDVIPTLNILIKKGYTMGIFSEGTPSFQRTKLKVTKLEKYFDNTLIYIDYSKREEHFLERLPEGCYIVDDNLDVIQLLVQFRIFRPIYLARNKDLTDREQYDKFKTINSLSELPELLNESSVVD